MQAVCSPRCAIKAVKAAKAGDKEDRKATKLRIEALKPRGHWLALTQKAFNSYIRARDAGKPCISCGALHYTADAGHYFTVGARPELRFHEDNVHAQCVRCNQHLHGNIALYREGLIQRIGPDRVGALMAPRPAQKLTAEDLKEMRKRYSCLAAQARAD